jgi:dTDP-4-dehydrorhamnose 3,5-epimerase
MGRPLRLRQGDHARSAPGVLRGFDAEPWDKLVQVVRGTVMAAIPDIRRGQRRRAVAGAHRR